MTAVIEGERLFVGPVAMAKAPWTSDATGVTFAAKDGRKTGVRFAP